MEEYRYQDTLEGQSVLVEERFAKMLGFSSMAEREVYQSFCSIHALLPAQETYYTQQEYDIIIEKKCFISRVY